MMNGDSMGVEGNILGLLKERPNGMDIFELSNELNEDSRKILPILSELQSRKKIMSGLIKLQSNDLQSFQRKYFVSP
ncbi:MAG: hypothetical protein ABIH83_05065 [Candidatus Micrarchaeota archaeon]